MARFDWEGIPCLVAGTGYTGEDGVECAVPAAARRELLGGRRGRPASRRPGWARATRLRLEAGLPLHGHELGPGITPLQAELGWVVGWAKGDFVGRAALEEEKAEGPARRLRGVVGEGRQPLRDGAEVHAGGRCVGR